MLLVSLKIFKNTRDVHQRSSLTLGITLLISIFPLGSKLDNMHILNYYITPIYMACVINILVLLCNIFKIIK